MTQEEIFKYNTYDEDIQSAGVEAEKEQTMTLERNYVKGMIMRFERTSNIDPDDSEDYVERRIKAPTSNSLHHYYNRLPQDRNSSVSVNSILSSVSEVSLDSNSSGFVSDRKSGTDYCRSPKPHRPAPPPPEPFNDSSSSPSRSTVPPNFTYLTEKRFSLDSPLVQRRVRQPPCIRRKSLVLNQSHQSESHWSYGVKQSDLEKLLRLKRSEISDNEEDSKSNKENSQQQEDSSSDESGSEDNEEENKEFLANDDVRADSVSLDHSTDTLRNDDQGSDIEEIFYDSESLAERSNYDNLSIKSISSFENLVPYEQYDSATVSSDEFGEDICHAPESEYLTVSALNECCVSNSKEVDIITQETKKEKYKRSLNERVNELVRTEKGYVDRLEHVIENYVSKMTGPDLPLSMRGIKSEIFANIDKIHKFHSEEFLPALKDCENDLRKLGQCFRRFEQKFNMYVMYLRNNKRATKLVYENMKFFEAIQHQLGDKLNISSYLLEPVQRLPKYKLFLDELVKTYVKYENEKTESDSRLSNLSGDSGDTGGSNGEHSENEETPLESLKLGKAMIEYVLRAVDGIMALDNIKDCPINLLQQGRLLRQQEFTATDYTKKCRGQMRVFLFDGVVLLTGVYTKQPRIEVLLYRDHIPLDDLGITAKEEDKYKFTIWYKNRNLKSYKLETRDAAVREAWVEEITSLLWEQANQTKELLLQKRNARISQVSLNSEDSSTDQTDKYNSLRGVPGEVKRSMEKKDRRTTWYCELMF